MINYNYMYKYMCCKKHMLFTFIDKKDSLSRLSFSYNLLSISANVLSNSWKNL